MATYVNDLRLKEIATGDESGTWGTSTNTNLELIADAFSYATKDCFATDADATETMADGVADEIRSLYLKVTSSATLTATRTLTLAPNTVSKTWIIENATTGGQSISISQGSGANVTIPNGDTKIIYTDGAGAGAAVTDAFANLKVTDPAQTNITSVGTLTGFTSTGIDDNATSTAITIDSNDNVGIGTDSPRLVSGRKTLAIGGESDGAVIDMVNVSNNRIVSIASDSTASLTLNADPNSSLASSAIKFQVDGSERMRIDSSGKVGIGTTSPSGRLTIGKSTTADDIFIDATAAASYSGDIVINSNRSFENNILSKLDTEWNGTRVTSIRGLAGADTTNKDDGYLSFQTASAGTLAEAMRIDSSGNVGIGTTDPNGRNLYIKGGGAYIGLDSTTGGFTTIEGFDNGTKRWRIGQAGFPAVDGFAIYTGTSDTERMRITATGDVGIGTSSPTAKLEVSEGGSTAAQGDTDLLVRHSSAAGTTAQVQILAGNTGFSNLYLSDTDLYSVGGFIYSHSSNYLATNVNGSERMRIDSSGNVGIGASPVAGLHIQTSTRSLSLAPSATGGGGGSYILMGNSDSAGVAGPNVITSGNRNLQFGVGDDFSSATGGTFSEYMRIDSSGNVGIGTSSPSAKLHVATAGAEGINIGLQNSERYWNIETDGGLLQIKDVTAGSLARMTFDTSGDVMIGTTASIAGATLTTVSSGNTHQVMRSSSASAGEYWRQEVDASNDFYLIDNNSTGVYITDGSTSWSGASDENLKENIVELTGVLDKVRDFRCVEYNLIADEVDSKKIGFIAQDWQEDYSQVVSQDNNGNLGMKYTETIPVLLKAIQEQQTIIESLEARITALES